MTLREIGLDGQQKMLDANADFVVSHQLISVEQVEVLRSPTFGCKAFMEWGGYFGCEVIAHLCCFDLRSW
jgi:hypothetical protein